MNVPAFGNVTRNVIPFAWSVGIPELTNARPVTLVRAVGNAAIGFRIGRGWPLNQNREPFASLKPLTGWAGSPVARLGML